MAYQYPLNGGRINASIGGNSTSAGAGYTLISTGTLHLVGGNNVTLSQNGGSVTISGANAPSQTAYSFSNSNGVSFGTNGSTITASVATNYAASNHSHGNPTLNLTNLSGTTASASNGLTLSISAAAQSVQTQSRFNLSLSGNTSGVMAQVSSGTLTLAGGNNITLSQNGNAVTISGPSQSAFSLSGNGVTFNTNGSTVSASVATTYAGSNHSHGNPTLNLTNLSGTTASNSGGLTLSLSAPPNFSAGMSNIGNTSGTTGMVSNQLVFAGGNNITLSQSTGAGGNTISISGASIPTQTSFSLSGNGITFNTNGSTVSASVATTYAGSSHSHGNPTLNLTNLSGTTASNSGGLTLSLSGAAQSAQTANLYVSSNSTQLSSTAGIDLRSITFQGAGAASFGLSEGKVMLSAPEQSSLSHTGAVSISRNGNTISIGAPVQTNQTIGISATSNTFSSSDGTVDARSLYLRGVGNASVGISNGSILISAGGGGGGAAISAAGNSVSNGTVTFSNSNGIGFGMAGSVITASHNGLTSQSAQAFSAQGGASTFQTLSFSNGNGFTFSNNAGQVGASYTVPTVTNSSMTIQAGASTLSSVSRMAFIDGNGVLFGASTSNNGSISITASVATTYAGSNHSHGNPTLSLSYLSGATASASNGLTLSLSAAPNFSGGVVNTAAGGSTSGNMGAAHSSNIAFYAGSNIGLSQATAAGGNASITIQAANGGGGGGGVALSGPGGSITSGTASIAAGGGLTASFNGQTLSLNAPASSSLSATGIISLSTNGNTVSIGAPAFSGGISNLSNDSGNTGIVTNRLIFAGGNNITLSQSTAAGNATVTVSGPPMFQAGVGNIGLVGGTTGMFTNRIVFAMGNSGLAYQVTDSNGATISFAAAQLSAGMIGTTQTGGHAGSVTNGIFFSAGNNITLSQTTNGVSAATIAIHGGAGGGGGGGVALYDGTNSISSGTARISVSGALTASVNGQTLSLNAPAQSSLSATGAISITNNGNTISIGAPATSSLVGINGITVSTTGSTISISGAGGSAATLNYWQNMDRGASTVLAMPYGRPFFQRMNQENDLFAGNMTVNTMMINMSGSLSTGASSTQTLAAQTHSILLGIYQPVSTNYSVLTLINSVSTSFGSGATFSGYPYMYGNRWLSFHASQWSTTPSFTAGGDYVFGMVMRSSGGSTALSIVGQNYMNSNSRNGFFGVSNTVSSNSMPHGNFWNGAWSTSHSTSLSVLPTVVSGNQLDRNNATAIFIPHVVMNNAVTY